MRKKAKKAVMLLNGAAMVTLMVGAMYTLAIANLIKTSREDKKWRKRHGL
tara:strand:- start:332 stop:481 length:150 start_codon:yes stop_codon:yes gene_type:complete